MQSIPQALCPHIDTVGRAAVNCILYGTNHSDTTEIANHLTPTYEFSRAMLDVKLHIWSVKTLSVSVSVCVRIPAVQDISCSGYHLFRISV